MKQYVAPQGGKISITSLLPSALQSPEKPAADKSAPAAKAPAAEKGPASGKGPAPVESDAAADAVDASGPSISTNPTASAPSGSWGQPINPSTW
jgi:hypothetical protein